MNIKNCRLNICGSLPSSVLCHPFSVLCHLLSHRRRVHIALKLQLLSPQLLFQTTLLRLGGIYKMTYPVTAVAQMYRKYQNNGDGEDCEDISEPSHFDKACDNL